MRRLIDVVVVCVLAIPAIAVVIVCAAVMRLDSKGPGLFQQTRVGKDGEPFVLVKVRTMALGTPNVATHEASVASLTRGGAVLRRTKLDELPQLWNVLRGDMSLIGPRPCLPTQSELLNLRREAGVLGMRPGVTGPAQVIGLDMSQPKELVACEAAYLASRSLSTDITILLSTVLGSGAGDPVRRAEGESNA